MGLREDVEKLEQKANSIEKSFAFEFLTDYKKTNKRLFVIILVILGMWFATIGYLVYTLNDIGVTETTQEITDFDTINGNVVNNGDIYGYDKANN